MNLRENDNGIFIWHGKGLIFLLKSRWEIVYVDSENDWMIIYFEKTLFTPEGFGAISRIKKPGTELVKKINQKLIELGLENKLHNI